MYTAHRAEEKVRGIKIMDVIYPYSEVFYKEINDDSPGWNIALISGEEKEVEEKVKKLWKNYKIFSGNESAYKIFDEYPINPEPEMTHLTSDWIWSSEINRWFFGNEIIPVQNNNFEKAMDINFYFDIPEDQNEISELNELYLENLENDKNIVEIYADVTVSCLNIDLEIPLQYSSDISERIKNFIAKIRRGVYGYLIIDEYSYLKILAWTVEDNCRVVFQDYNGHSVIEEPIRIEINKEKFLLSIEKFYKNINFSYLEMDKKVRNLKKQHITKG